MNEIKLPSHWKEVSFGEVCTLRKESVQPTNHPDIAYVGLEHIDPGHPNLTRSGSASEVKSSKSKFYKCDILYGKLRPYLDKAVLAEFEGICSTDILVFTANGLTVDRKVFQKPYQSFIFPWECNPPKSASNLPFKHICSGWTHIAIACGRDRQSQKRRLKPLFFRQFSKLFGLLINKTWIFDLSGSYQSIY